jgi:ABC-type amino acid transport substrate-binding protein
MRLHAFNPSPKSGRRGTWGVHLLVALVIMTFALSLGGAFAAEERGQPAPTLVPPTLVPTVESFMTDALPSESGIARIMRDGVLRVGILYNEPPFGELNPRGEVFGFDADIARAFADAWGLSNADTGNSGVQFKQVTRQTAVDTLLSGQVDLLIAAMPHRRELDSRIEFSQSYYPGYQAILVRNGDGATVLQHMAERKIGVVVGNPAEVAVADWLNRVDYTFSVTRYLTLDQAIVALNSNEIDGVVESRVRLERAIVSEPERYRIVDDPVMPEPFAVGLRRQDANLRNLVNRTLQYLYQTGRLNELYQANFSGASLPDDTFVVWQNVGDEAPRIDQFPTDVPLPGSYVVPRLQTEGSLRVAGLRELPSDAPESARRLDGVNRALVNALAMRWNVTVVPVAGDNLLELVNTGQADLAVGVTPDWNAAEQVDFTTYYLVHGLRLMLEANANVGGFGDLRGRWIGIFADEPGVAEIVRRQAEASRAIIDDIYTITREQDAAFVMLVDNNADAVFGDSLKLIPHVQANPNELKLLTTGEGESIWFSREFIGMAVPRNDIDFRLLVEYTMQELVRDGELQTILQPVMMPNDMLRFDLWPGSANFLGFNIGG